MDFHIEGVLGIKRAEFALAPGTVTVISGQNASGKTSLATALQGLLTMDANPLHLSVADVKRSYPNDTATDGYAALDHEGQRTVWRMRSGKIEAPPSDPLCRPESVGIVDFTVARNARERADILQRILLPEPKVVEEALRDKLGEYLNEDDKEGLMSILRRSGWSEAESIYIDRARDSKRQWARITGRPYGVRVAADWRPEGWQADFDSLTVQQAESRVVDYRDALSMLTAVQAISEHEAAQIEAAKTELPALEKALDEAKDKAIEVRRQRDGAHNVMREHQQDVAHSKGLIQNMQDAIVMEPIPCPHCGGGLSINNGEILDFDLDRHTEQRNAWTRQIETLQDQIRATETVIADVRKDFTGADKLLARTDQAWQQAKTAQATAETLAQRQGTVSSSAAEQAIVEAEQAQADAVAALDMVKSCREATKRHETIARYTEIAKAIGPAGVRAQMLDKGMATLRGGLNVLTSQVPWNADVAVTDDGSILVKGRPVVLCSESERWMAQACLQMTIAAICKDPVVVLDRADLLDTHNSIGLLQAVQRVAQKTDKAFVLCVTGRFIEVDDTVVVNVKDGEVQ